jgi:hypothetical protein
LLLYNPGDNPGNGMDAPLVFVISGDFFYQKDAVLCFFTVYSLHGVCVAPGRD